MPRSALTCLIIMLCFLGNLAGEEEIMPLEVGNSWEYSYKAGEMSGEYICEITERYEQSGTCIFKMEFEGVIYTAGYYQLYSINDQGEVLFYGDSEQGELETPEIIIKYPLEKDFTWVTSGLGAEVTWEVIDLNEEVTVPAGTFQCVHVFGTNSQGGGTDHWYAPGVGDVKIYQRNLDLILELEDYQIK
ncbi:MAG: hypothetical protein ACP5FK_10115, partial [bacterium]